MPKVKVMGIVNVTPDSFSGDGLDGAAAIERALALKAAGADVIDVGGESTRPGHTPVPAAEEWRRVRPVVRALARAGLEVSIDTSKLYVAQRATAEGARMVNDVWGLQRSPGLARLVADAGLRLVVMHNQVDHVYSGDLVEAVIAGLKRSLAVALAQGVPKASLIVDPGVGFGKTAAQNLWVLRRLPEVRELGYATLVGVSRKSFLGRLFGEEMPDRVWGTAAAVATAILNGADWIRVHDVREMRLVADVAEAVRPVAPTVAHLGLGSNLGDRASYLARASRLLEEQGATLLRSSRVVETEPWGDLDQPRYLNQVLEISWPGTARELLVAAKEVESQVGRTPTRRWGPREIDVDILLFGAVRIEDPDLVVPHPRLVERDFNLALLAELGLTVGSW